MRGHGVQRRSRCARTQGDAAAVLARGTGQRVHQGGFAGTVAPQQRQGFAFVEGQVDAVQNHSLTVTGTQIFNAQ